MRYLFYLMCTDSRQLLLSVRSSQLKNTYDASKEASNQQVYVRMLGSSIKLSLLSRGTSKVQLPCLKPRTIATKKSTRNFSLTNRNEAKEGTIIIYSSRAFY